MEELNIKRVVIAGVIGVTALITVFGSFTVIPSGSTGVVTRMGQVQEEALTEGVHLKIPFIDSVKKVDNKQQDISYDGQVWCESSEQTPVFYENISLSYQISPNASVWLYRNVSKNVINDGKALITPSVLSSAVKNASVQLVTRDVTKRASIEPLAQKELQASLDEKYGEGAVTVVKLSIGNADFEAEYNKVIAERQSAQILYEKQQIENKTAIEKAEADAEKAKIDADAEAAVAKTKAEGEAEAIKAKAEGEAEAIKTKADAQTEANKKLQESLTKDIITKDFIEKWNGELPKVQGDGDYMLDISDLTKSE